MTKLCISNDLVKTNVGLHDRCLFKTVMFKKMKRLTITLVIWLQEETYFKRPVMENLVILITGHSWKVKV